MVSKSENAFRTHKFVQKYTSKRISLNCNLAKKRDKRPLLASERAFRWPVLAARRAGPTRLPSPGAGRWPRRCTCYMWYSCYCPDSHAHVRCRTRAEKTRGTGTSRRLDSAASTRREKRRWRSRDRRVQVRTTCTECASKRLTRRHSTLSSLLSRCLLKNRNPFSTTSVSTLVDGPPELLRTHGFHELTILTNILDSDRRFQSPEC